MCRSGDAPELCVVIFPILRKRKLLGTQAKDGLYAQPEEWSQAFQSCLGKALRCPCPVYPSPDLSYVREGKDEKLREAVCPPVLLKTVLSVHFSLDFCIEI